MDQQSRQWVLRRRPVGQLTERDIELISTDNHILPLRDGEVRLRNILFHCAPTMRNWMGGSNNSFHRSIELGSPITSVTAGRVLESCDDRYPVGTRVVVMSSWTEYDIIDARTTPLQSIPDGMSAVDAVGRFGLNSQTAYFGMLKVGRPRAGETLVVSGAAGSTGSIAAQIGRIMGCRVIGIAGGAKKCKWLMDECRLDAALDYRAGNIDQALAAACPEGINLFYDNVGGEILQAGVNHMARFGRIVLCGQISSYNDGGPISGINNMMRLIYGSIRVQGFVFSDYMDEVIAARDHLVQWSKDGLLSTRVDIRAGFELLPKSFNDLFDGRNEGTLLGISGDDAHAKC